jgi:hypothetical protein
VPPISVVLAAERDRYIASLMHFREDKVSEWVEHFAAATAPAAQLATSYLHAVQALASRWRERLSLLAHPPRSDAAAWAIINLLPAHPLITAPVAGAVTGRSRPATYQALQEPQSAGVLVPLSQAQRNRVWEADGLLDLLAGLDAGRVPP